MLLCVALTCSLPLALSFFHLFKLLFQKKKDRHLCDSRNTSFGYQSSRQATLLFPGEISAALQSKTGSANIQLAWDQWNLQSPSTFYPFLC